jgi:glucose/arabinose dehydrogenase
LKEAIVKRLLLTVLACGCAGLALSVQAQAPDPAMPAKALPSAPFVIDTAEQGQVRIVPIKGLANPWSLVFLPNGDMLVTERPGRLRIVRNGAVVATPISACRRSTPKGSAASWAWRFTRGSRRTGSCI